MKIFLRTLGVLIFVVGCARVQVQAPKEPIKVDISMRLDIYQHIKEDIDDIENIVSGSPEKPQSMRGVMDFVVKEAYAQEGLSPEVEQAAFRRRDRKDQLSSWQAQGVIGENKSGLVEIRKPEAADGALRAFVEAENADRMMIYKALAEKNGSTVEEVQKLYAKRLQADAPAGTPVQVAEWQIKN